MAGLGSERIVIANWNARLASIIFLLLFVVASLGGIYDPFDPSQGGDLWPGALFVAVATMLALRGLTVGVVIVGDRVISRGRQTQPPSPAPMLRGRADRCMSSQNRANLFCQQFTILRLCLYYSWHGRPRRERHL